VRSPSTPIRLHVNVPLQSPAPQSRKRKSSGVVVPNAPRWHQRLAAWLIVALIRSVGATIRFKVTDHSGFFTNSSGLRSDPTEPSSSPPLPIGWGEGRGEGAVKGKSPEPLPLGPAIYCIWHNRLALSTTLYQRFVNGRNHSAGLAGLVSASKDGAFLAAILKSFGVEPVRGSSSRRGPQALLELTTLAERGYDLAITPDGPRGPCYAVQEGVMSLAQITGLPVLPVSFGLRWKIRLRSWDRFQIPLPFSLCEIVVQKPINVPREATDAEREVLRQKLEGALREISKD